MASSGQPGSIPPILREVPESFESERLLIRCPHAGDGAELSAAVRESHDQLRQWMPWAQTPQTAEETEAHVRKSHCAYLQRTDLQMLLFRKDTGTLVGSSGLHRIDWEVPRFEIGYWCRASYVGNGYITEAVRRITVMAFDELHARRVEIHVASDNARSLAVAERAGYVREAVLRNLKRRPYADEPYDMVIFSLIPEDYARLKR